MENLFENHYERTPAVMKELYRYICFRRPVTLTIYIVFGVIAVASIIKSLISGEFQLAGCVGLVVWTLMNFVMYRNSVSNAIMRDKAKFGPEPLKVCTVVTEEGVQCTYGEKTVDPIALTEIKKVWQTKSLIMLYTNTRLVMIFHKDNFTVGTREEFLEYLREQGIKA